MVPRHPNVSLDAHGRPSCLLSSGLSSRKKKERGGRMIGVDRSRVCACTRDQLLVFLPSFLLLAVGSSKAERLVGLCCQWSMRGICSHVARCSGELVTGTFVMDRCASGVAGETGGCIPCANSWLALFAGSHMRRSGHSSFYFFVLLVCVVDLRCDRTLNT